MAERRVTISKLDYLGRRLISYPGDVVIDDDKVVAARCIWTLPKTVDLGAFAIVPGDTLVEYFYRHRPFNIFAIYGVAGTLKGWYCNVLERTLIAAETIDWVDLALDLVVTPCGSQTLLDEDEFEALGPTPEQRTRAQAALNTLNEWVQRRHAPFDEVGRLGEADAPVDGRT
ncbi:MAG: DUF402 domain-containing protein [Anaerolineae bacterium]